MTFKRTTAATVTVLASILLAACFLLPGKFESSLDIRRDGRFTFSYKGEIVLVSLPNITGSMAPTPIKDDPAAPCFGRPPVITASPPGPMSGPPASDGVPAKIAVPVGHVCTPTERDARSVRIAKTNANAEARRKRDAEQMAQMVGMDPSDETSMRAYAALVAKQAGWRSVAYRGNGIFDVDFEQSGTLDRDFVFPVLPRASMLVPFVIVRKRSDGAVLINAPAFRSSPGQAFFDGFNKTGGAGATRSRRTAMDPAVASSS